jgi:hypothetical protein
METAWEGNGRMENHTLLRLKFSILNKIQQFPSKINGDFEFVLPPQVLRAKFRLSLSLTGVQNFYIFFCFSKSGKYLFFFNLFLFILYRVFHKYQRVGKEW